MKKYDGYVILTDLDGTLLTDDKKVSPENRQAIEYFIDNGGKFTIATGRPIYACSQYIEGLRTDLPAVVYNGGTLYDCNLNKIIKESFLFDEQKELPFLIHKKYPNIGISIYSRKDVYVLNDWNFIHKHSDMNLNIHFEVPENILDLNWNTVLLMGEINEIEELRHTLLKNYDYPIVRSGSNFCEILPIGVSKGNALRTLSEIYDFDMNKTIAAGDNINDIDMLKTAKTAFCPQNASPETKKYAQHITVDNEHHIIPHILKYIDNNLL